MAGQTFCLLNSPGPNFENLTRSMEKNQTFLVADPCLAQASLLFTLNSRYARQDKSRAAT